MSPLPSPAADLARRLAERAEAVPGDLSNGHRCGRYWCVGDVANGPGRSLYVRLHGPTSGPGAAGHWADAATGEHGDLLDLIRLACGLPGVREAMTPRPEPSWLSRPRCRGHAGISGFRRRAARWRPRAVCSGRGGRLPAHQPRPTSLTGASPRSPRRGCAITRPVTFASPMRPRAEPSPALAPRSRTCMGP